MLQFFKLHNHNMTSLDNSPVLWRSPKVGESFDKMAFQSRCTTGLNEAR